MALCGLVTQEVVAQLVAPGDDAEQFGGREQVALAAGVEVFDGFAQIDQRAGDGMAFVEEPAFQRGHRALKHTVGHAGSGAHLGITHAAQGVGFAAELLALHIQVENGVDEVFRAGVQFLALRFGQRHQFARLRRGNGGDRGGRGEVLGRSQRGGGCSEFVHDVIP